MKMSILVLLLMSSALVVNAQQDYFDFEMAKHHAYSQTKVLDCQFLSEKRTRSLGALKCVYRYASGGFTYSIRDDHPWASAFMHLRVDVSTVELIKDKNTLCLTNVNPNGECGSQISAIQQTGECVTIPRQRRP